MEDLAKAKEELRRLSFERRRAAFDQQTDAAMDARDHFLASRLHTGSSIIAGYCPIRTELDPTPLMSALHGSGHRICVPVIVARDHPLEFREWWPGVEMAKGAFGAEIPVDTDVLVPDLLLVPLVAFDDQGWRLGYGGGFYDRSLEGLRALKRTPAYGVAFTAQQTETVPVEKTDQRLNGIVTEMGVIRTMEPGSTG